MNGYESPAVLVTGGGRGIGRGVAVELATRGYSVGINYRSNSDAALETVELCRRAFAAAGRGTSAGGDLDAPFTFPRFVAIQGDVSKTEDRSRMVAEAVSAFGGLDALVNNAGIAPRVRADIVDASEESFEELMTTNLQGPYFMTQEVVRYWLGKGECGAASTGPGRLRRRVVVYVTSVSSELASTSRGEYCISKAGLSMAVQLWAVRLAAEGIDVFEVRPGIIETDLTAVVKEKYDTLIAEGLVPQKRWGYPEDIGRIVRSMIAGDFGFSTGTVVHSDGGLHIGTL